MMPLKRSSNVLSPPQSPESESFYNKRIIIENNNDDNSRDSDILDYPQTQQNLPNLNRNYDDDGEDDLKIMELERYKKDSEIRREIKQSQKSASEIMDSIKLKNINALVPNLATILSLSKKTRNSDTVSKKLTNELVMAIEHNVREFMILDNYVRNNSKLLKQVDEKNANFQLDLQKIEMRIRELWSLAEHLNSIDSSISINEILNKLQIKFQKLKNLAEEYNELNEIYQENKKTNENLQKRLDESQARETKLLLELNKLKTANGAIDSQPLDELKQQLHNEQVYSMELMGQLYEKTDIIKNLEKTSADLVAELNAKNVKITDLQKNVESLYTKLQMFRDTKNLTQKICDSQWASGTESQEKKDKIAYRIHKIVDSLQSSDSNDLFPRYLLNFTNLMLNENRNATELDIFLDDIKQINGIIKSNDLLQAYIDDYLTQRQIVLRGIDDLPIYNPETYSVPMELTYEFDDSVNVDEI